MVKRKLIISVALAIGAWSSHASAGTPLSCVSTGVNTCEYTYTAAANYGLNTTTVTFNNWGYAGPTGVGVNDFKVGTGFDSLNVGQRQTVTTLDPNWKTSDPAMDVLKDANPPSTLGGKQTYTNASMDATVNFYAWTYTTIGGSTFTNMEIDKAGNYFVAKNNMSFQFYDVFKYHDTTNVKPDATYDTVINFKPYAVSDARGWCGSVLTSGPNSLEQMAGQVTFDFAFDAYLLNGAQSTSGGGTQIVPSFVMRSYGDYTVRADLFGVGGDPSLIDAFTYRGSAVGNNTNPESVVLGVGGTLDPAWSNKVSFLGAGVVPNGVWVKGSSYVSPGVKKLNLDGTWDVTLVDTTTQTCDPNAPGAVPEAGAVCWRNSFAGYPFLMRADGSRVVTYINTDTGWTNYAVASVPIPGAIWLLGSGLFGLGASAWRRKV